jgi:hypothetical protein
VQPPDWLPDDATWIPWGDERVAKVLIFRNTLPNDFTLTGDYYPKGVFCDKSLFMTQGAQACFDAVGR